VIQCEAEQLSKGPRRTRLEKRATELRIAHASEWGFEWCEQVSYRRGFATVISTDIEALVAHGARLFATTPVAHLSLTLDSQVDAKQAIAIPGIGNITTFEPSSLDEEVDAILRTLVTAPVFDRLTTLVLGEASFDNSTIELLQRSTTLPALTCLQIRSYAKNAKVLKAIAKHRGLRVSFG
jgi:hypothetical protein